MARMNGNAGVISQQGKGSQFWMELPKKKGAGMNNFLSTLLRVDDDSNNVMLFRRARFRSPDVAAPGVRHQTCPLAILTSSQASTDIRRADDPGANP